MNTTAQVNKTMCEDGSGQLKLQVTLGIHRAKSNG